MPDWSRAATFDQARADFESAWRLFLSKRTEEDFQEWRDQRDWTARKYALWDAGKRLELPSHGPGKPVNRFRKCLCGAIFDMRGRMKHCAHASSYYCRQAVLSAPQRANVN